MAANGGSRIERSGWRFGRLLREANGSVGSFRVALKRGARTTSWGVTVVSEVGGMDR
jgi:hypothetical protein